LQLYLHAFNWGKHDAENKYMPLDMRVKKAWVVTDWINGACGMERTGTTEAVRC